MLVAVLFSLLIICAGCAVLRPLGLLKGLTGLTLAVPAGLAAIGALSTWAAAFTLPAPIAGVAVALLMLLGLAALRRDAAHLRSAAISFTREHRAAAAVLGLAMLVPVFAMGVAFYGIRVPLSPHDGAYHVQVADLLRHGNVWWAWYPPGTASTLAAVMQLMPWVDSAQGAYELALAFSVLAPLAVFGLGVAVVRNLLVASLGALLIGFTYLYPYFPQIWSGWPLLFSLLLTMGLWVAAVEYLDRPSWQLATLAGLLLGVILLVHGTELYTLMFIFLVLAIANWRRIAWWTLTRHLLLAGLLALVLAAPYLPTLLHWAGGGGAFTVGYDDGRSLEGGATSIIGNSLLAVFLGESLGIDLPIRVLLVAVGIWAALRHRRERTLVAVGAVFVAITLAFSTLNVLTIVRQLYAITYPWGMHYRLLMLVSITHVLLAGLGAVELGRIVLGRLRRWPAWTAQPQRPSARRIRRLLTLLAPTWLILTAWALVYSLVLPRQLVDGYVADDEAAMRWLRANASPGEMVANDGFADAGIWTPYKAGLPIVLPRMVVDSIEERSLVLNNVTALDRTPEAAQAACALGVGYVYYGAKVSEWDERQFRTPAELAASGVLEEVFRSGQAVVLRVRLHC